MCSTSNGHRFIVEMQKGYQKHFLERSQYYVDRAIVRQGYKGKGVNDESWDYSFEPVVGVFFCNFHVPELPLKAVVKGRLFDEETLEPMGDYTRFVYIQIPFFNKDKQECVNQLERWIFNIKNMGVMQSVAFTANNDIFNLNLETGDLDTTLLQSYTSVYAGDSKMVGSDSITIQLHHIKFKNPLPLSYPKMAYTLAINYPDSLAASYVASSASLIDE